MPPQPKFRAAHLWDALRRKGMSPEEATATVEVHRKRFDESIAGSKRDLAEGQPQPPSTLDAVRLGVAAGTPALAGLAAGSMFGPVGAAAGGALGFGMGMLGIDKPIAQGVQGVKNLFGADGPSMGEVGEQVDATRAAHPLAYGAGMLGAGLLGPVAGVGVQRAQQAQQVFQQNRQQAAATLTRTKAATAKDINTLLSTDAVASARIASSEANVRATDALARLRDASIDAIHDPAKANLLAAQTLNQEVQTTLSHARLAALKLEGPAKVAMLEGNREASKQLALLRQETAAAIKLKLDPGIAGINARTRLDNANAALREAQLIAEADAIPATVEQTATPAMGVTSVSQAPNPAKAAANAAVTAAKAEAAEVQLENVREFAATVGAMPIKELRKMATKAGLAELPEVGRKIVRAEIAKRKQGAAMEKQDLEALLRSSLK